MPVADGATVCVPLLASEPDQSPEAVQPDVPLDDQVRVADPPGVMLLGLMVNVGAAGGKLSKAALT